MAEKKQGSGAGAKVAAATAGASAGGAAFSFLTNKAPEWLKVNKEKITETVNEVAQSKEKGLSNVVQDFLGPQSIAGKPAGKPENIIFNSQQLQSIGDVDGPLTKLTETVKSTVENNSKNFPLLPGDSISCDDIYNQILEANPTVSEMIKNDKTGKTAEQFAEYAKSLYDKKLEQGAKLYENLANSESEVVKENSKNIFQKASGFIGDKFEQFGNLETGQKALVIGGAIVATIGTAIIVDKLLSPKTETKAGTMEHHGQVQQQVRGMHAAPA